MRIVGINNTDCGTPRVQTIDIWFSERRRMWFVERLDAEGHQLGLAHRCDNKAEAEACLEEWLREHSETELVVPSHPTAAERRLLAEASRRAA